MWVGYAELDLGVSECLSMCVYGHGTSQYICLFKFVVLTLCLLAVCVSHACDCE